MYTSKYETIDERVREQGRYILHNLAQEAALLCHRGERLAREILEDDPDDIDARIMRRKLAFFKDRTDLFIKYRRLPLVTYGWELDEEWGELSTKAAVFEREWEQMDKAFDVFDSLGYSEE